jgi:dihydrofolate synthase/folylpolyglutamate synthase
MNPAERRAYLGRLEKFGIRLGLENVRTLLADLGNPQNAFPSVLVAGTNGKGSVCAMLAEALRRNGLRTGLYTSPHLVRVEERIRIDGAPVPSRTFGRLLEVVRASVERLVAGGKLASHPTYFEVLTAAALLRFAERKADIAVLEVGLGGRFDATNAVTPLVSVITTIALDHQEHLGRTLGEIAFEKAGIVKPGVPVVCGVRRGGDAYRVIRRRAREIGAPFLGVWDDGELETVRTGRGYRFTYRRGGRDLGFSPGLAGKHQGANAAVALAAAGELRRVWKPLDDRRLLAGIANTSWEGRLEIASRLPLVILDGAHNPEGATALATYLREVVRRPVVLVFGVMKDKDAKAMARSLFPLAETIILTSAPLQRSASPAELRAAVGDLAGRRTFLEPRVGRAVRLALRESLGRTPVVVAGSLYLVGEVKRLRLFPPRKRPVLQLPC